MKQSGGYSDLRREISRKGYQAMTTQKPPSEQEIERIRQQELARAQAEARECKAKAEMYLEAADRLDKKLEQQERANRGGCYIATACYGSYDHPDVRALRRFRDEQLLPSLIGKHLVSLYYAVSPELAAWIGGNRRVSRIVRRSFLEPLVERLEKASEK